MKKKREEEDNVTKCIINTTYHGYIVAQPQSVRSQSLGLLWNLQIQLIHMHATYLHVNANRAVVDVNGISAITLTVQERAQQARLALPSFAQEKHPRLLHRRPPLRPQHPQIRQDRQPSFEQDLLWNLHVELDSRWLHVLQ